MDTIRGCLEVLFKEIPNQKIGINEIDKKKGMHTSTQLDEELFLSYAYKIFPYCSNDEILQTLRWVQEQIGHNKTVFNLLIKTGEQFLNYGNRDPNCKYEQILRWRDISFQLEQDLFTTAFLATKDMEQNLMRTYFSWNPVISTDNKRLSIITQKGIAENHFHLKGSTRVFTLSWVCLMNHIVDREREFKDLDQYLETRKLCNSYNVQEETLYESCIKAAKYRLYLYLYMKMERNNIQNYSVNSIINNVDRSMKVENAEFTFDIKERRQESFNDVFDKSGQVKLSFIREDTGELDVLNLQQAIEAVATQYGAKLDNVILDYAIEPCMMIDNQNSQRLLSGERKFMYQCFQMCSKNTMGEFEQNIFYRYLVIKTKLRGELIQINRKVGFDNFSNYEIRKELFIDDKRYIPYRKELYRLAINSTINCQNIQTLEARLAPKDSIIKLHKCIEEIDMEVQNACYKGQKISKEQYFYVVHFIKRKEASNRFTYYNPRHWKLRASINRQTDVLVNFLQQDKEYGSRIRGIDAANCEIGCRPEVFASNFRYLLNRHFECRYSSVDEPVITKLQGTYHVGEDFLDLADGLRAIDEVILFLNFKRGNRLGHALALGISPKDYYESKHRILHLPKQDILDNAVWLLEKAKEFGIQVQNGLFTFLERKYEELFAEIYQKYIKHRVTSYEYYQSWKLRGDDPEIYLNNDISCTSSLASIELRQYYKVNHEVSEQIRKNELYRQLYFIYHYGKEAKEIGAKIDEVYIEDSYIDLISSIQKSMIEQIYKKSILIECNPSSNYLIGTILKYEEHPMMKFNSFGLEEQDYPLSVSVNTDDQGVFDTSLENEYALVALALEKKKNENGKEKYSKEQVYRYIDYIRELGIEQVFTIDSQTTERHLLSSTTNGYDADYNCYSLNNRNNHLQDFTINKTER